LLQAAARLIPLKAAGCEISLLSRIRPASVPIHGLSVARLALFACLKSRFILGGIIVNGRKVIRLRHLVDLVYL
jgi:hypothetical protein